jgi:hypothetical protein
LIIEKGAEISLPNKDRIKINIYKPKNYIIFKITPAGLSIFIPTANSTL